MTSINDNEFVRPEEVSGMFSMVTTNCVGTTEERTLNKVFEDRMMKMAKFVPIHPGLVFHLEKPYQIDKIEFKGMYIRLHVHEVKEN